MAEKIEKIEKKISGKKGKKMNLKIENVSIKDITAESEGSNIPIEFSLEIKKGGKIMGTCHVSIDNLLDRVEFGDNQKNDFLFKPYETKRKSPKPKEKNKKCEDCGKMFLTNYRLRVHHDSVHKGLKPFQCKVCSKAFARKEELAKHQIIHTGDKPYKCDSCGKSFIHKCYLVAHVDIAHKGLQPFKCEECEKCYSHKFDLKRHVDIVHKGLKPFKCSTCDECFNNKYEFKRHKKTHEEASSINHPESLINPRESSNIHQETLIIIHQEPLINSRESFNHQEQSINHSDPSTLIGMDVCENEIARQNLLALANFSGHDQPLPLVAMSQPP